MGGYEMAAGGMFWMVGGWVVLALAIVAGAWLIARSIGAAGGDRATPLNILEERFARGDIDKEGYESAKHALR